MRFEVNLTHVLLRPQQIDDSQDIKLLTQFFVGFLVHPKASCGFATATAAANRRESRCLPKIEELVAENVAKSQVSFELACHHFIRILIFVCQDVCKCLVHLCFLLALVFLLNLCVQLFNHAVGKGEILEVSQ